MDKAASLKIDASGVQGIPVPAELQMDTVAPATGLPLEPRTVMPLTIAPPWALASEVKAKTDRRTVSAIFSNFRHPFVLLEMVVIGIIGLRGTATMETLKAWAGLLVVILLVVFVITGIGDWNKTSASASTNTDKVTITKSEYEHLKTEAATAKQVGRYQLTHEGVRTWRLDTATGESCLMLTVPYDWEHKAQFEKACPSL